MAILFSKNAHYVLYINMLTTPRNLFYPCHNLLLREVAAMISNHVLDSSRDTPIVLSMLYFREPCKLYRFHVISLPYFPGHIPAFSDAAAE